MADELYRWLDRETAERLLSGEPLEAVDATHRDQAERLAKTLESLTVEPPLTSEELPGEDAALAAFRAARAQREEVSAAVGDGPGPHASDVCDAPDVGLVRIGAPGRDVRRPRWARPVRLGLAAALAVGMVGGVAVATGTGVLPTPFDSNEPARPAVTASVPVPSERPLISPSPGTGAQAEPTPDDDSPAPTDTGAPEGVTPGGGPAAEHESAGGDPGGSGGRWKAVTSYCRALRDGKPLSLDRRRSLEGAAGSAARVRKFCKNVLATAGDRAERGDDDGDKGDGQDEEKDRGKGKGEGKDRGKDKGHRKGHGKGRDHDGDGDGDRSRSHDGRRTHSAAQLPSLVTGFLPDRTPPASSPAMGL
ncbi:hypothetical protein [Streptomyces sp. NPDC098781]|uniref:hypothetical protein n=1 Tax=Streptomyces sp. NPDC098781 TaxID=3366097 RepID=UPI00381AF990